MTITNQFITVGDFWSGMVEPDYEAHLRDLASLRAALHAAISLFHMSDWVFQTHESKVRAAFHIPSRARRPTSAFADALERGNQDFGRVRGICHAAKHLKLADIRPVPSAPSHSANTRVQTTGLGAGGFGSGPFCGEWCIGRIYGNRSSPEHLRWFWALHCPSKPESLRIANQVATLEAAKAEFETSWKQWKAWAKLEEAA